MPESGNGQLSANTKEDTDTNIEDINENIKDDNVISLGNNKEDIYPEENFNSTDFHKQDYMNDNNESTEKEDTDNNTRSDIFYFPELGQIYDEEYFIPVEG